MKVLIIDNYDSFVYNLAQYVGTQGAEPVVLRNDRTTMAAIDQMSPDRIIISPGPGTPADRKYFGVCGDILKETSSSVPILGVCLGNHGIGHAFGAKIVRASRPMHGKTSSILHDGRGVLKGVESPLRATRYHSLVVERKSVPDELRVTALSLDDGEVMGLRHRDYPIEGVQFHPESILTEHGMQIVGNFLRDGVKT